MLWVTWRHHRTQLAACLGLLAAAGLLLAVLGHPMHTAWNAGPAGCLGGAAPAGCDATLADFQTRYTGSLEQLLGWFNLLPALIGAFIGAPLVAREFESRHLAVGVHAGHPTHPLVSCAKDSLN